MTIIDPKDLRPGDRVRVTMDSGSQTVVTVHEFFIEFEQNRALDFEDGLLTSTWELLDRPALEPTFGSLWVDLPMDTRWVYVGDGKYVSEKGWLSWTLDGRSVPELQKMVARLVPAEGGA